MNAVDFIKEHGVDKAREVVEVAPDWASEFCSQSDEYINYSDTGNVGDCNSCVAIERLKHLVESVDLVKRYGGIAEVKTLHQDEFWNERVFERLKQAIADYENIYGESE